MESASIRVNACNSSRRQPVGPQQRLGFGFAAAEGDEAFQRRARAADGEDFAAVAFAGGAVLTMLANTMMPEALHHGGKLAGLVTTIGFALAFAISSLQ